LSQNVFLLNVWPAKDRCFVNRLLIALVAFLVVGSTLGQPPEPNKFRITTWNLEWFPNGSAHEATQEKQAQRIKAAADVLKELNPDILLLQELRDYDACNRLAEAIRPGVHTPWLFAPPSREGNKKKQFLRRFQRKLRGQNLGNQWKESTHHGDSLLHGSRLEMQTLVFIPFI
jgi:hypothetical protein